MRVFQSTYKDKHGHPRKTKTWYIEFRDHLATVRRTPDFSDRKWAEALELELSPKAGTGRRKG